MRYLLLLLLLLCASCTSSTFYENHLVVSDLGKQALKSHASSSPISVAFVATEIRDGNTFCAALRSVAPTARTQVLPTRQLLDTPGEAMAFGRTRGELYQFFKKNDWLPRIATSTDAYLVAERPQLVVVVRLGRYVEDGEERLLVLLQAIVFAPLAKGAPQLFEPAFDYEAQVTPGRWFLLFRRDLKSTILDAAAAFASKLAPFVNTVPGPQNPPKQAHP